MKRRQTIGHPSELSALSVLPWVRMPGSGRIVITDERLEEKQRAAWEQKLNRLYFACGCDRAAIGLALGVIGYLLWLVARPGRWSEVGGIDVLVGVGVVAVTAGVGKTIGLVGANRRLKQTVRDIQGEWKVPRPTEGEVSTCG